MDHRTLESIFDGLFAEALDTVLRGGFEEPLYLPADRDGHAVIRYRADYSASALHEVAHWCVAGPERRRQLDWGYWYESDGRSPSRQAEFEHVEARPQALESIFAEAAGLPFVLSADNLQAGCGPSEAFAEAVDAWRGSYRRQGLPDRAARFEAALRGARETERPGPR